MNHKFEHGIICLLAIVARDDRPVCHCTVALLWSEKNGKSFRRIN